MERKVKDLILSMGVFITSLYALVSSVITEKIRYCKTSSIPNYCFIEVTKLANPVSYWLFIVMFFIFILGSIFFAYMVYTDRFDRLKNI